MVGNPAAAMQSHSGSSLSASEKKKLRRKKAKQSKKELKTSHVELHAALHKAQEAEGGTQRDRLGRALREADALLNTPKADANKHVIEYVPEPITALEALTKAVEEAAIEDNPYDGVSGMEISDAGEKTPDLNELQRIAQHFASKEDKAGSEEAAEVVDEPLVRTEVVKEKEDDKPDAKEGTSPCLCECYSPSTGFQGLNDKGECTL